MYFIVVFQRNRIMLLSGKQFHFILLDSHDETEGQMRNFPSETAETSDTSTADKHLLTWLFTRQESRRHLYCAYGHTFSNITWNAIMPLFYVYIHTMSLKLKRINKFIFNYSFLLTLWVTAFSQYVLIHVPLKTDNSESHISLSGYSSLRLPR